MYDVNDITDYVIIRLLGEDSSNSLINLKLQKLLYYIQAWHYGIYGNAIFNGRFQAWVHGPVCIDIYNRFKETKTLYSFINIEDVLNSSCDIKDEDKRFIDWILENYACFSGVELEGLTHNETPWIDARGKSAPNERCSNIITPESLIAYYSKRWEQIKK